MFSEPRVKQIHKCWIRLRQCSYNHCKHLPSLLIAPWDANEAHPVDVHLEAEDAPLNLTFI